MRNIDWVELMGRLSKDVRARGKAASRVKERDASGLCLLCERKASRRGLCSCCYSRWYMFLQRTGDGERANAERNAIIAGELMPDRQGQRIRKS
jgi:hypothetical protein